MILTNFKVLLLKKIFRVYDQKFSKVRDTSVVDDFIAKGFENLYIKLHKRDRKKYKRYRDRNDVQHSQGVSTVF